jgi:hypothetical protein
MVTLHIQDMTLLDFSLQPTRPVHDVGVSPTNDVGHELINPRWNGLGSLSVLSVPDFTMVIAREFYYVPYYYPQL